LISRIRKRDGRVVKFQQERITSAIHRALIASGEKDGEKARRLSDEVVGLLERRFAKAVPSVEDAQDAVVRVLRERGYGRVAEEYERYRRIKHEIRELRKKLEIEEEPKLTANALEVLRRRYLLKNERGEIVETPAEMLRRVARAVASVDENPERSEREFYDIMRRLEFLPNSPTLFNAGAPLRQLSACFVLPVEDSLESIFDALKLMAIIEKTGGGVGFDFSNLRPKGDVVRSTKGVASGPVSFMRIFDVATEVIKAGGKRRGAMMGILRVDHPDIEEFIRSKSEEGVLTNFNISVAVTDEFMRAVEKDLEFPLVNPRNGETVRRVKAGEIWSMMAEQAWKTGDPGVIFIDEINRRNPTPEVGRITATNPCGEQPLLPYESCNLGSINLARFVRRGRVDWRRLGRTVRTAVRFLDNVIDANEFPHPEIERMTKANRKIGLGVMGFADMLVMLGIPYDSQRAVGLAGEIARFITDTARKESARLGRLRGSFPNFSRSVWRKKYSAMRNATVTTIAPTGTISIIAGCSSGVEPIFALSFMRRVLEGSRLFEVNPLFERVAKERGFYSAELLERIARTGSARDVEGVPEDVKRIFRTALDIAPEWHVRIQAAFQRHIDNSVSKTVNLPQDATVDDVKRVFELAYRLKCKGITVYRYGSKREQVLYVIGPEHAHAEAEYSGGCPSTVCIV